MFVFVSISIREIKRLLLLLKEAIPKGFSSTLGKCHLPVTLFAENAKRRAIGKQVVFPDRYAQFPTSENRLISIVNDKRTSLSNFC